MMREERRVDKRGEEYWGAESQKGEGRRVDEYIGKMWAKITC